MYVQQQHPARMKENIVLTGKNKDTATEAMSVSWKNTAKSPARFAIKLGMKRVSIWKQAKVICLVKLGSNKFYFIKLF